MDLERKILLHERRSGKTGTDSLVRLCTDMKKIINLQRDLGC